MVYEWSLLFMKMMHYVWSAFWCRIWFPIFNLGTVWFCWMCQWYTQWHLIESFSYQAYTHRTHICMLPRHTPTFEAGAVCMCIPLAPSRYIVTCQRQATLSRSMNPALTITVRLRAPWVSFTRPSWLYVLFSCPVWLSRPVCRAWLSSTSFKNITNV